MTFEHILDEPFYQLVRPQLMAHALERAAASFSADNRAYQQSRARPEHRALGSKPFTPDVGRDYREITSRYYVHRYGVALIHELLELFATYELDGADDVEDAIDFEGDVIVRDAGVELRLGRFGTVLDYPFTLFELNYLVDELEAEVG